MCRAWTHIDCAYNISIFPIVGTPTTKEVHHAMTLLGVCILLMAGVSYSQMEPGPQMVCL